MTTSLAPVPPAACWLCSCPDVVRGDGPRPVCPRCIAAMGRVVVEPFSVPESVRERLLSRSLDVVALVDGAWRWTASWPPVGDHGLIRRARA